MAKRRKKSKPLSVAAVAAAVGSAYLVAQKAWPELVIYWVFALLAWVAFFKRTQCDVETAKGVGCGNDSHGRLRACHIVKHKRLKNDALWRMIKLQNPGIRTRILWASSTPQYARVSPPADPGEEAHVMRPLYDGMMLAATVLGALVAVITLGIQIGSAA